MRVISFKICPFVQRVTALLEAKGLPYDIEYISLAEKPQWFLDLSPNGQVPVLITDSGVPLFESEAIVEYLEEAYPPLRTGLTPEDRAVERAWSALATKNYLVQCSAQRSPDRDVLADRSARLGTAFDKIEAQLGDSPYFSNGALGMVDLAWLPLLHRASLIESGSGYDFIGDRPKLKAWQRTLLATGLAERSVATDFEPAFSDFYLSEQTYLGRGGPVADKRFSRSCATDACC